MTVSASNGLNDTDWARLAGFFDADGSATMMVSQAYGRAPNYTLRLELTNCHTPTLEDFQQKFGGIIRFQTPSNTKARIVGRLQWRPFADILRIGTGMLPFLFTKKERIELMIAAIKEVEASGRVYTAESKRGIILASAYHQLKILNARGMVV